ncbi:MAG: DUF3226 domain-containing protein [Cyanobacteria bacterium P01_G01_bin.54]
MPKQKKPSKVLLVEGKSEQLLIPYLMEANGVPWPDHPKPVFIKDCEGYNNILRKDFIATQLQAAGLTALGIMVDADENPGDRWQRLQRICAVSIPDLPQDLPQTGLVHPHNVTPERQIQFGIWMMPDNTIRGMLETFLAELVPDVSEPLWEYAQDTVTIAKTQKGASFKPSYQDKANVHTWLAWQDEPGLQLHQAVMAKVLDPQHPKAGTFVDWFKQLYGF